MACNASSQLRTLSNTAETPHHCHSRRHPASVTVTLPRPTDRLRASARKRQLETYLARQMRVYAVRARKSMKTRNDMT